MNGKRKNIIKNRDKNDLKSLLKMARFNHVMAGAIVCLAAVIGLSVFIRLMQPATAMTRSERAYWTAPLRCTSINRSVTYSSRFMMRQGTRPGQKRY